jgi:excisionase family DNA binding protein
MQGDPNCETLSPRQVAILLRCHIETVYRMIHNGRLPAMRINGRGKQIHGAWRIAKVDLIQFRLLGGVKHYEYQKDYGVPDEPSK